MFRGLVARLTYANVVSTLGLFLVLTGGTALAIDGSLPGQNTVGTADIINGEVTQNDLGGNSIGSNKIADQSVKNNDLGVGASSSNTILDGGIESIDVKNETLTGADVADGGLSGADLDPSSLDSLDLVRGPGTVLGDRFFIPALPAGETRSRSLYNIPGFATLEFQCLDLDGVTRSRLVLYAQGAPDQEVTARTDKTGEVVATPGNAVALWQWEDAIAFDSVGVTVYVDLSTDVGPGNRVGTSAVHLNPDSGFSCVGVHTSTFNF